LRIGINAHLVSFAASYRQAGVSKYTELLVKHLAKLDEPHDYIIYWGNENPPPGWGDAPNQTLRRSRLPTAKPQIRIGWEQFIAPPVLLRDRLSILHCPVNVVPLAAPCPTVVTIHDLGFMLFPDRYKAAKRRYLHTLTALSTKRAAHIITPSESVRREVSELLKVKPEKITAIPEAAASHFRPLPRLEVADWRKAKGLPEKFVLYVGTLEPRKNLPLLLRAFAQWRKEYPADAREVRLVLGGGKGWLYDQIFSLIQELELYSVTDLPGYIPENELALWYNSARCVVYPSVYEGFGLPPLEAMACGCPVITSNTSSLPEVVGDAGIMVAPLDVDALCAGLQRLVSDDAERERYAALGLARARGFSWETAAAHTLRVYKNVG
jgi:glycosyltransferase involved in cell wall biosynthesis